MSNKNILQIAKDTLALASAATPGPWECDELYECIGADQDNTVVVYYADMRKDDARFTSEVRTNAPLLAEAVIRLTAQRDELHTLLAGLHEYVCHPAQRPDDECNVCVLLARLEEK